MRPEIIVIIVIFAISAIFDWVCLIVASRADERAKIAEANLEKEKQRREPRIVMLEGECAVRTLQPDSAEMEGQNERKE